MHGVVLLYEGVVRRFPIPGCKISAKFDTQWFYFRNFDRNRHKVPAASTHNVVNRRINLEEKQRDWGDPLELLFSSVKVYCLFLVDLRQASKITIMTKVSLNSAPRVTQYVIKVPEVFFFKHKSRGIS